MPIQRVSTAVIAASWPGIGVLSGILQILKRITSLTDQSDAALHLVR
jgi:hypothetical protein